MYTCPQCSLQIDDGFAPLPPNCPQCGTATGKSAGKPGLGAPPPPPMNLGGGKKSRPAAKTIFGMPPAGGPPSAPPPPPGGAGGIDLPAPAGPSVTPDLDLPAPAGFDMPAASLDDGLDLPAPAASGDDGLSLDLPTPATRHGHESFDLPTPAGTDFGDIDLPAPPGGLDDLDLPAPAEDLPAPAENLPTPAADLAPAGFEGLQLDIDRVGGVAPKPEPRPGFDGGYASSAENSPEPEPEPELEPEPAVAEAIPEAAAAAAPKAAATDLAAAPGRQLSGDEVINHRASPAPKRLPLFTPKRLAIIGGSLLLVVGGIGGAYALGLFDGETEPVVERGAGTQPKLAPGGPAVERGAAVLARFDEDTPQSYQQALAMLESQGERVGQAEAALLLHARYGPDPVLVGKARELLGGYESDTNSYATRVFGLLAFADGQYDAALQKLDAKDPRAKLYRAWVLQAQGKHAEAIAAADEVLAARPDSVGATLVRARARAATEDAGLEILSEAYEAHANHPRFIFAYAQALLEAGQLSRAAEIAAAFESAPIPVPAFQSSTLILRAHIAAAQGNTAAALRYLEQAKELNPRDLTATLARIRILLDQGDNASARSEADIIGRDNPGVLEPALLNAEVAIALGEGDLALERLAALPAGAEEMPRVHRLRGRVHAMRLKVDEARAEFTKARELDPLDTEATSLEAKLLARANQAELGLEVVETHLSALPEANTSATRAAKAQLLLARAGMHSSTGQAQLAKADLEAAIEVDPRANEARLALANAQLALGERTAAEKTFLALAERTGNYPGLTGPLGRIYLRRGELERLEALIGEHLADERASDEVTLTGAMLRLGQGKPDEAMKLVDRVLVRNPNSWEGHLARGRVLFARGEYEAALIEFEQSRPSDPNSDVEFWLGRALEETGQERKALGRFQRAVELEPGNVLAAAYLGRRLAFGGQSREAISMLEPLVGETEEFPFAFAVLGRAYYDIGNRKKALEFLRKARRLDPKSFEASYWEGRIEGDANNHAAASRALASAVEVAPDQGPQTQDAWRRLGRAYQAMGRKPQARQAYERYLQMAPPDASGRAEAQRNLRDL